jgi:hypothetical protein
MTALGGAIVLAFSYWLPLAPGAVLGVCVGRGIQKL